eukprot:SAG11_NODE_4053_length_2085_cov_4.959718_1_plen_74_part_00
MQKSSPQPKRAEESESVMMMGTPAKERSGADGHGQHTSRQNYRPRSMSQEIRDKQKSHKIRLTNGDNKKFSKT